MAEKKNITETVDNENVLRWALLLNSRKDK